MTKDKIRVEVAQRLRKKRIPNEIWEWVLNRDYVAYAERGGLDSYEFQELLNEVGDLLKVYRGGRSGAGGSEDSVGMEEVAVEIGAYEEQRAAVYAEYVAKLAAHDAQPFRDRHLGGQLLAPKEIEGYLERDSYVLRSPLVRRLSRQYRWSEDQAVRFILTGETPAAQPIMGRLYEHWGRAHNYGVVTLTVEPWVSSDEVRDAYVRLKKEIGARKKVIDKRLALFRFVVGKAQSVDVGAFGERTALVGAPSWERLRKLWNEQYPSDHDWRYKEEDRRNFARDFRAAEYGIANPIRGRTPPAP